MAIDPAVQAAQLLHELSDRHFRNCINICQGPTAAEKKTAALIRRQAFTEAADRIEAEKARVSDVSGRLVMQLDADLVRGLSEGTV